MSGHSASNEQSSALSSTSQGVGVGVGQSLAYRALMRRLSEELPPTLLAREREQRGSLLTLAGRSRDAGRRWSGPPSAHTSLAYDQNRVSVVPLAGSVMSSRRSSVSSSNGYFSDTTASSSDANESCAPSRNSTDSALSEDSDELPLEDTNLKENERPQSPLPPPNAELLPGSSAATGAAAAPPPLTALSGTSAGSILQRLMSRVGHLTQLVTSCRGRQLQEATPEARDRLESDINEVLRMSEEEVAVMAAAAIIDEETGAVSRVHDLFWKQSLFCVLRDPQRLLRMAGVGVGSGPDALPFQIPTNKPAETPQPPSPSPSLSPQRLLIAASSSSDPQPVVASHVQSPDQSPNPKPEPPAQSQSSDSHTSASSSSSSECSSLDALAGLSDYTLYLHMLTDMRLNNQLVDVVLNVQGTRMNVHYQALARVQ